MQQITNDDLSQLLGEHQPPCISLYQPTHRHYPENQQDPIRYRNQLTLMEESLREKYPKRDVQKVLAPFQSLSRDENFWNTRTDGLAMLASGDVFRMFELQRPVKELLVVADTFHLKPLMRILQSADRFQILCLSRQEAHLYEGNRDSLDAVEITQFPTTLTEVLGTELTEPHSTVASYGGVGNAMHHGHGGKKEEVETDVIRFFRAIDRSVLEHHSRPSGLPLLLAALPEAHEPFRRVTQNSFLLSGGIMKHPTSLTADQLRLEAWRQIEPLYVKRLTGLIDAWQEARSRHLGSDELSTVAHAAVNGRVATLLVEADRVVAGRMDRHTGAIHPAEINDPGVDDVLDDLAEAVLRQKGEVVIVPADRMPSASGLAATFRF